MVDKIILKNYMEDCVLELIPSVLNGMDICKCERCQMDIAAYTLNKLPPKYVATGKGHMYTKLDTMHAQFGTDIISIIAAGAKLISENPRHE